MRIEELELVCYGNYQDRALPFGRTAGVQVVHGGNGDGKTTALESSSDLLFGFPERTRHDYRFPSNALRLRGKLTYGNSQTLEVVRRKGRKNTLSTPDGRILPDETLAAALAGIDRRLYETMFALSHARLREGAQALLEARGDLAEALFGAGLGSSAAHHLIERLERRADEIFLPRASRPLLNAALRELDEARHEVRALSLPTSQRQRMEHDLSEARDRLASLNEELFAARTELGRLERLEQAIPSVAERATKLEQLAVLQGIPRLPADATQRRTQAMTKRAAAERERERNLRRLVQLTDEFESLDRHPELVSHAEEIDELHSGREAYLNYLRDIPRVTADLDAALSEADRLLQGIAPGRSLKQAETLRPRPGLRAAVSEAKETLAVAAVREKQARKTLADAEQELAKATVTRPKDPPEVPVEAAAAALAAARRRGDLDEAAETAAARAAASRRQLDDALAALPLWSGTANELAQLKLPSAETIASFESTLERLQEERRDLLADAARCDDRMRHIDGALADPQTSTLPSEDAVRSSRATRDTLWSSIRRAWLEPEQTPSEREGEELAVEFETASSEADELVDRLRTHALQVAERDRLLAERDALEPTLATIDLKLGDLASEEKKLEAEWQALWSGLEARTPAEMRGWLGERERVLDRHETASAADAEAARAAATAEREAAKLAQTLAALGVTMPDDSGLQALIEALDAALTSHASQHAAVTAADTRLAELEAERASAAETLATAITQLEQAQADWRTLVSELGSFDATHPAQIEATLTALDTIFAQIDKAADLRRRVAGMERDRDAYANRVAQLVESTVPALATVASDQAVAVLRQRLDTARAAETKAAQFEERIGEARTAAGDNEATIAEADAELQELCGIAGTDVAGLEEVERQHQLRMTLEAELLALETTIAQVTARPLEEALAAAASVDIAEITARVTNDRGLIAERDDVRTQLIRDIGQLELELNTNAGSDAASAAEERAQAIAARCQRLADEYARTKLAATRLRRAIESYRERNQGPVLARARELFPQLTLNRFDDIGVVGGGDELAIVGKRGDEEVHVADMSDGERDALYLALRLASLEHHLKTNDPMPLIVDDILIGLDEPHVRAALRALGELASQTQVIVFTHHAHVVDIARDELDEVTVHELAECDGEPAVLQAA